MVDSTVEFTNIEGKNVTVDKEAGDAEWKDKDITVLIGILLTKLRGQ